MIMRALYFATLFLCFFTAAAFSHPHLFIDVMVKFMLTDSTLSGFNVFWDMDEMYSASLIDEFDINRNNRFEKEEYKKRFHYFQSMCSIISLLIVNVPPRILKVMVLSVS